MLGQVDTWTSLNGALDVSNRAGEMTKSLNNVLGASDNVKLLVNHNLAYPHDMQSCDSTTGLCSRPSRRSATSRAFTSSREPSTTRTSSSPTSSAAHGPFDGWSPLAYADGHIMWRHAALEHSMWNIDTWGSAGPENHAPSSINFRLSDTRAQFVSASW